MAEAGVPAPRCNFTHLTVTVDEGASTTVEVDRIFSHVESIKDPFLRRHFGSDQDQGRLYEGTLSDFWTGSYRNTIESKTPEAAADTTEIDALTSTLEDTGLSDAARLAAIQGRVDVDDFLTFWAAEGLVGHWDGYVDDQNNFWFYVDPADGLIRFIPWGTDDTWGRGNTLPGRTGDSSHCEAIVPRSALARRLYEIASTNSAYLTELQRQLDDVIEALILPYTGSLTTELAPIRTFVDDHRASVQAEITSPFSGFSDQFSHFCIFNP
jgi:spore coat protein CotH